MTHEHVHACGNAYDDVREMVELRGNAEENAKLVEKFNDSIKAKDQIIEEKGHEVDAYCRLLMDVLQSSGTSS